MLVKYDLGIKETIELAFSPGEVYDLTYRLPGPSLWRDVMAGKIADSLKTQGLELIDARYTTDDEGVHRVHIICRVDPNPVARAALSAGFVVLGTALLTGLTVVFGVRPIFERKATIALSEVELVEKQGAVATTAKAVFPLAAVVAAGLGLWWLIIGRK